MARMLDRLFHRTSCPMPTPGRRAACVHPRHFAPLVGFLIPSLVIGYGIVLPHAGASGVNAVTIGFASTLLGASVTYMIGVLTALRR